MLRNEKGFVMPLALMVMFVVSLLGIALWQYSMTDTLQVTNELERMQAYYLAKSGADITMKILVTRSGELNNMPFYLYGDLNNLNVVYGIYDGSRNNSQIVVTVVSEGSNKGKISSIGNINGVINKVEFAFNYNAAGIINGIYK